MFPSSASNAVLNSLREGWEPCFQAWKRTPAASNTSADDTNSFSSTMKSISERINSEYDKNAAQLGRIFVEGDESFNTQIKSLTQDTFPKLHQIIAAGLRPGTEQDAQKLALLASETSISAMNQLASRKRAENGINKQPSLSRQNMNTLHGTDVPYCKGALMIQSSSTDISGIAMNSNATGQSYFCKYCYMEISDFRMQAYENKSEQWSALARCHILACPSFQDRRAAYRCVECYERGNDIIEVSSAALQKHLDACPIREEAMLKAQRATQAAKRAQEKAAQTQSPPLPKAQAAQSNQPRSNARSDQNDNDRSRQGRTNRRESAQAPVQPRSKDAAPNTPVVTRQNAERYDGPQGYDNTPASFPQQSSSSYNQSPNPNSRYPDQRNNPYQTDSLAPSIPRRPAPSSERVNVIPQQPTSQAPPPPQLQPQTPGRPNLPGPRPSTNPGEVAKLSQLKDMGMTNMEADVYLRSTHGDVEQAVDMWLNDRPPTASPAVPQTQAHSNSNNNNASSGANLAAQQSYNNNMNSLSETVPESPARRSGEQQQQRRRRGLFS